MKTILTTALLMACLQSFCQSANTQFIPEDQSWQLIDTAATLTASEIYQSGRKAAFSAYKYPKEAIQLDDPNTQQLIARGNFDVPGHEDFNVKFNLTFEVKDSRYRIIIDQVNYDITMSLSGSVSRYSYTFQEYCQLKGKAKQRICLITKGEITGFMLSISQGIQNTKADNEW